MSQQILNWLIIILCAASFVVCDSLSALWARSDNANYLSLIFPLSPLGYLLFGYINKNSTLSASSALVNSIIVITTISIGIFFLGDELPLQKIIGLVFAVFAVILTSW